MTDVKVPSLAESVTEGEIGSWLKADGSAVTKDEPILELQTDKASVEIAAPASGTLRTLKAAGDVVKVGELVARIEESARATGEAPAPKGASAPKTAPAKPAAVPTAAAVPTPAAAAAPTRTAATPVTPAARPAVEPEAGPAIEPTPSPARGPLRLAEPAVPAARTEPAPGTRRERMSRLRRRIAERLVEAQHEAAILSTFNEIDMTAAMALRQQHQEWFTRRFGVKLGYMSLFSRAVVAALRSQPLLNASIVGDEVEYHDHVHLGIAVQTERGLVVPVVRNAETMGLGALEKEISRLAALARAGKVGVEDLEGGTFTISNGGVYGSLLSTPILNPPQSGILGMHAIQQRPICLKDGTIVARPMMYVALSYDHRLVDGKQAVTFLVELKALLEDGDRLMLEA